ncbi:DUF2073 domain-containing protein [Natronomonas sp. F2-12]|uniref:DUF2073 domain-containing protein n=2 Tax=Natronomonas aquatica TaxID=2841590 RepID=A0A9R1CW96_9EURY|nr:DUF2073 domain-containing protein [Natronomonas aquatica]
MPGITADDDGETDESVLEDADPNRSGDPNPDGSDSAPTDDGGIQIDMISADRIEGMRTMEKIRLILDGVHDGNIVILERGLDPDEESKLIEVTMSEINPDGFTGIEIETYPGEKKNDSGLLGRLIGNDDSSKLTVIGPANRLETLHKDETLISTLVTRT